MYFESFQGPFQDRWFHLRASNLGSAAHLLLPTTGEWALDWHRLNSLLLCFHGVDFFLALKTFISWQIRGPGFTNLFQWNSGLQLTAGLSHIIFICFSASMTSWNRAWGFFSALDWGRFCMKSWVNHTKDNQTKLKTPQPLVECRVSRLSKHALHLAIVPAPSLPALGVQLGLTLPHQQQLVPLQVPEVTVKCHQESIARKELRSYRCNGSFLQSSRLLPRYQLKPLTGLHF